MRRPLLIGQAPAQTHRVSDWTRRSKGVHDRECFDPSGPSAIRLMGLLGMTPEEYDQAFDRINLCSEFPGRNPATQLTIRGGDLFDVEQAQVRWSYIRKNLKGRKVVFFGGKVGKVVGCGSKLFTKCDQLNGLVFPHPSGVSRYWNDPGKVEFAANALKEHLYVRS